MLSSKASRWLGSFILLMSVLRLGFRYYYQQQAPATDQQMVQAKAHVATMLAELEADQARQRAADTVVVLADSTLALTDTLAAQ